MLSSLFVKALVPTILLSAKHVLGEGSCATTDNVQFTFFGLGSAGVYTKFGCTGTEVTPGSSVASPDNAPHPNGGDGSYENPGLFATAENNPKFKKCEIVYLPLFKKYFQYGDICEQCATDYSSGAKNHIDLWIGPNPEKGWQDQTIPQNIKPALASCESAWGTMPGSIIQNPPKNLEVQSETLDDGKQCYNTDPSRSFPSNKADCSSSGSDNGANPSPPPAFSSAVASQPDPIPTPVSAPAPAPAPSGSPSTSASSDHAPETGYTPKVEQHIAVNVPAPGKDESTNAPAPAPSTSVEAAQPTAQTTTHSPPTTDSTNSTEQAGDICPPNGWFPGCVWGSGPGKLGDSCAQKTDCHGEFICVSGKCADNTKKAKTRRMGHLRRHIHLQKH